jgi:hypothetical protein
MNFRRKVHDVLAVVVRHSLAFGSRPGGVGVHGLPDGDLVPLDGIDARFKLCEEFSPFDSDFLRADASAVPADCFPVALAFVIGVPKTVHAVGFAGAGITLGGHAVEDAFKLGFVVFSVGCAAHGAIIQDSPDKRKELIQNLSGTENFGEIMKDNYAELFNFYESSLGKWDAMYVCVTTPSCRRGFPSGIPVLGASLLAPKGKKHER